MRVLGGFYVYCNTVYNVTLLENTINHFIFLEIRSNSAGAVYSMTDRTSLFGSPVPEQDECSPALSLELPTSSRNKSITIPTGNSQSLRTNEEVNVRSPIALRQHELGCNFFYLFLFLFSFHFACNLTYSVHVSLIVH